ncbi:MAG TPA: 2,5-diamino-6-(ribosylamino)-4(3H)-pyrimidinone 5'-phosphate reductase [Methanocorpusculum sp.]|nr:2,5-diamino-6-(ribosylamino)-4(3H)-pyrimidinone 5'-phosphate reductase [Methanocorpusculum sp.]HJJ40353.1 2,5-diamino-6-(ribosylamino)-4(3H)-pyrimidinone 5'-phosphate reductase [Methanocorpusculum sp.]HJJ49730.1 2,5-diamino-6-(ribosylamino)-4(3H)-pyrimidinone 5'-phosphate reductase [Methanocorpusculum sp.]HJJ57562.1 2,5-diamino-6-(ribosylamino)-4(3H)-pyrimidinone 5'-phosphate reductase [Methanocorpusculum sp.]
MRPYVIINAAMSADGKISTPLRRQTAISGTDDFARVQRLRADCDAVLVGIGTIKSDDPSLRIKDEKLIEERLNQGKMPEPFRIIVDSKAEFPLDSDMFKKGAGEIIVVVSKSAPEERVAELNDWALVVQCGEDKVDLDAMLDALGDIGIEKLMVEGGSTILWSFMSQRLFDEIRIYVGALIIGGATSPTFADGEGFTKPEEFTRLTLKSAEKIDDGILLTWLKKNKLIL